MVGGAARCTPGTIVAGVAVMPGPERRVTERSGYIRRGRGRLVWVHARSFPLGGRMCVGGYRAFLVLLRVLARSLVGEGRVSDGGGVREDTSSWRLIDHDGSAVV